MINSFNTEIAKEVGVNAAVIFYNISFWIEKNACDNTNLYDNNYWACVSIKDLSEQFEYLTVGQIRTAVKKLIDSNLVIEGHYNYNKLDRRKWYAISEIAFDKYNIPILQKINTTLITYENDII